MSIGEMIWKGWKKRKEEKKREKKQREEHKKHHPLGDGIIFVILTNS